MNPINASNQSHVSKAITTPVYLLEIEAGDGQEAIYLHDFGRHSITHDGKVFEPGLMQHNLRDRLAANAVTTILIDNADNRFGVHVDNTARPEDRKINVKLLYGRPPWNVEDEILVFKGAITLVPDTLPDIIVEASTVGLNGGEVGVPMSEFDDELVQAGIVAFGGEYYELEAEY